MAPVHSVRLKCSTCGQPGLVHWAHPEGGQAGPRRLIAITQGFTGMERGNREEPEVLCLQCNDVPHDGRLQIAGRGAD